MQALVSLLPDPYFQMVEDIWSELETRFGASMYMHDQNHISWQYADCMTKLMLRLGADLSWVKNTFEIQTDIYPLFRV